MLNFWTLLVWKFKSCNISEIHFWLTKMLFINRRHLYESWKYFSIDCIQILVKNQLNSVADVLYNNDQYKPCSN